MSFEGQIVYGRTFHEVEKATMDLVNFIKAKKKDVDQICLGLDMEWKPSLKRENPTIILLDSPNSVIGKSPGKVAVIQICADNACCHVMHIIHSGIAPILQSLLEDSALVKVGVSIAADARKFLRDYEIRICALKDLSALANLKLGGIPRSWGLGSLTEALVRKQVMKPYSIRLGNWDACVLSEEQLQYAATDAFVSWHLHEVLSSYPDASENSIVEKGNAVLS